MTMRLCGVSHMLAGRLESLGTVPTSRAPYVADEWATVFFYQLLLHCHPLYIAALLPLARIYGEKDPPVWPPAGSGKASGFPLDSPRARGLLSSQRATKLKLVARSLSFPY